MKYTKEMTDEEKEDLQEVILYLESINSPNGVQNKHTKKSKIFNFGIQITNI